MGKGSKVRPRQVSRKQFEENWDRIFGKREDRPDPEDEKPKEEEPKGTDFEYKI